MIIASGAEGLAIRCRCDERNKQDDSLGAELGTRGTRAPRVSSFRASLASLSSLPFDLAITSSTKLRSSTPKAPYISMECKGLFRSFDISGRRSLALSSGRSLLSKRDLTSGEGDWVRARDDTHHICLVLKWISAAAPRTTSSPCWRIRRRHALLRVVAQCALRCGL